MKYFSQLLENAPNEFIRKIHQGNIRKLEEIHQLLFHGPYSRHNTSPTSSVAFPVVEKSRSFSSAAPAGEPGTGERQDAFAWLISHTEDQPTRTYPLRRGRNIIGRKSASAEPGILCIDDGYISRKHAVIECGNTCLVYDIGELDGKFSTNGIYLNARPDRLKKKTTLHENDTIQIGLTKLVFKLNQQGNLKEITDEIEQSVYLKTVVIDL